MLVLAIAFVALAVVGAALWLWLRDDDRDGADFFLLPTAVTCAGRELRIELEDASYTAHFEDEAPAISGNKYLVADLRVTNQAAVPLGLSLDAFTILEPPDGEFPVARTAGDIAGGRPDLPSGSGLSGQLLFSVPREMAAGKLVYDDGCAHEEWLVP
jgi:hypothetical protein